MITIKGKFLKKEKKVLYPIPEFENYFVTRDGEIFGNRKHLGNPLGLLKQLKGRLDKDGYRRLGLYSRNENKQKSFYVHRLVAQVFIPRIEGKSQINHIDGKKANNCVANLEWVTQSENQLHAYHVIKTQSPIYRSVEQLDKSGNFIQRFKSIKEAKEAVKGSHSHIISTCQGKLRTAYGFKWRYADGN